MAKGLTNADFEQLSWHDNALYGFRLDPCDPDANDWRSDLILTIDHIVEWVPQPDSRVRFRVAPATLTFHNVADLSISIDWGTEALHEMSIDGIERQTQMHPSTAPGAEELAWYRWRIALNWPIDGSISFGASGYTQHLLAEPVLLDEQTLSPTARRTILSSSSTVP